MSSLLDRIVDELKPRLRHTASGALSLAHICCVVTTAQAGRRLRQRLAREFGALIPPLVKTPAGLLLDEEDPTLATRTDVIRAFGGDLKHARALADLRALLAPQALTFADVASNLETDFPEESERWRSLAEHETRYLAALNSRGKTDRILAEKEFRFAPEGIEEILRYDEPHPSPSSRLPLSQIIPCGTMEDEANAVADYFAAVKREEALPALCVADPTLFPAIESAFAARGLRIHNPSRTPLKASSLGHLISQIASLLKSPTYSVFSAFVRGGDVRRWLKRELNLSDEKLTAALIDLDNRQAEFLPEKIDDIAPKTSGTLRNIFEFVKVQLRKKTLRQILSAIFKDLLLDEADPMAREFVAAATVVRQLLDECGTEPELFALRLEESSYSLEPDEGEIILTDGWLELPFVEAEELVICGLQEGCVPESTVGHPYLPDSLRKRLDLPNNASKEVRDRAIFQEVLCSRAPNAVRVYTHAIDAKGDVVKPSRLLFETPDDAELVARVKKLYGFKAGSPEGSVPDLPEAWKLQLPIPPVYHPLEKISPTRLDGYLRCPFTYYLRDKSVLGDKRLNDRAEELASWEYGNLAHEALEAFGVSPKKDATDAAEIRAFLEEKVDEQLVARFGMEIPIIVAMQGESVKHRLANFAEIQAARRAAGWQIVAVERKLEIAYPVRLHGKCDRIDYNPTTGEWCVIDYKTWDVADKASCFETKRDGTRVWKSLQLPIYCAMLDMDEDEPFKSAKRDHISACYCILGKTKDHVVFTEPMRGDYVPEAEKLVRELINKIEKGIFWPPAPTREWQYDYADWLMPSPEESVSQVWIKDQLSRVAIQPEI